MKRKRRIQWYYSVILLAFGLTACQVKRPDTVISDAKMENVLYDFGALCLKQKGISISLGR